jgi:hypothetical protein
MNLDINWITYSKLKKQNDKKIASQNPYSSKTPKTWLILI